MKQLGSVLAYVAIAGGIFAGGFGVGWMTNGWRLGNTVETVKTQNAELRGTLAVLEGANLRCKDDVESVKTAIAALTKAQNDANDLARESAKKADPVVEKYLKRAEEILKRPLVLPNDWCGSIKLEQESYVRERRRGRQ